MTFTTFHVRGEVQPDFRDQFLKSIRRDTFRPLEVEDQEDESIGWCAIEHPFDLDLDYDKVFFNSYLNLGFRIDKWKIPAALFKAFFTDAERSYLEEVGRERLSRRDKEELKAVVTASLRRQLMPTMKTIDMSWNLDTGILRFWNQSTRVHEILEELFERTFGLRLIRDAPYIVAMYSDLDESDLARLSDLGPTPFHNKGLFIDEDSGGMTEAEGS